MCVPHHRLRVSLWPTIRAPLPARFSTLLALFFLITSLQPWGHTAVQPRKTVLIINEVGLSHVLTNLITQEIVTGVGQTGERHVEFYSESLDLVHSQDAPSPEDIEVWLGKKYGGQKIDVVVADGPQTIEFLSRYAQGIFLNTPIVICGSSQDQAGSPLLDSRFTGTWQKREPEKTLAAALRLFPRTKHVIVVVGNSTFDKFLESATKSALLSYPTEAELTYLSNLDMNSLLQRLQVLPDRSIVFYVSFFEDATGHKFVNATKALPMVAAASNVPVFGMSDTYLGNGIVGGDVMSFRKQGKVTARYVSDLLDGKRVEDLPIQTLSSEYMFDWNQLRRWHIRESSLPSGSTVLFHEPGLWERAKWIWAVVFFIILGLFALALYLQNSRQQLELSKESQRQLSGMLINAEEKERHRLASELHDDFSQRLAVVALRLENVEEQLPAEYAELREQLHLLLNSVSEIGADLHSLSHRLHSATLENLGLVPALSALCKEFSSQYGIKIDFNSQDIPRSLDPNVALCIFRIVQEALWNVKKYSGVKFAAILLKIRGDRLEVSVRDEGVGLDLKDLARTEGLGIRSMEQRASQLGGEFKIQSAPGCGTSIRAWVPCRSDAARAAGQSS
jgi:signal transduction histidine kinase